MCVTDEQGTIKTQLATAKSTLERVAARGVDVEADEALLFRTLVSVGRALGRLLEDSIRPYGLSKIEFRVLMELFSRADGCGFPSELSIGAQQSLTNMTRIADVLVSLGLISRVARADLPDRRRVVLQIIGPGEALVRAILPGAFQPLRSLMATIPLTDRREMQSQLQCLAGSIDALQSAAQSRDMDLGKG